MSRPRDSQRSKLYAAEDATDWRRTSRRFHSVQEMQEYVSDLHASAFVYGAFPTWAEEWAPVVTDGRGRRRAGGSATKLKMPKWSRRELVLLHEVAHSIMDREYPRAASHGPEFAHVLLRLVFHQMGKTAYRQLKDAMIDHGVNYSLQKGAR